MLLKCNKKGNNTYSTYQFGVSIPKRFIMQLFVVVVDLSFNPKDNVLNLFSLFEKKVVKIHTILNLLS